MNTSSLLIKCLENEGVEYIFGVPGEEMIHFLDALRLSSIKFIVTADERGASFMAATYGRLKGKPGVVAATLGPGALNILNGLGYAHLSGFPVIALTWQSSLMEGAKSNGFQFVDIVSVLKPVCKSSHLITSPAAVPSIVRNAVNIAMSHKQGVSHIQIYEDVSSKECEEYDPLNSTVNCASYCSSETLTDAASMIKEANHPVILAGIRSLNDKVCTRLQDFSITTNIQIVTTPMAQGLLPDSSPLCMNSYTNGVVDEVHSSLELADLFITVGYDAVEYNPKFWNNKKRDIVNIDFISPTQSSSFDPNRSLIGDISNTLEQLGKLLKAGNYENKPLLAKPVYKESENRSTNDSKINPRQLIEILRAHSKDTLFTHDNGMHKLWMTKFFHPAHANQVLIDNTLAAMGSGIPNGIVTALLNKDKRVVVNIGDGGLLMCLGELGTANTLSIPLTILIWNDGSYGMIKWHQAKNGFQPFGTALPSIDYGALAQSFGGVGFEVNNAAQLQEALVFSSSNTKLTLIDCKIDYSDNLSEFGVSNV